ncbi:MAG: Asp-tRNA(Asn)/Glu-tRNA(Gln) amidotransferase subunit GatC [Deltaproteobacteria bacterium TMED126]|jgi:aspartyl-tRNA(Asn)/glutamyl-tRNA(Gln) amidotransferase subunit C|nr:Asp-tRNA(Asn)/Glu-tRNA(Gln) amidotransferase subunit GatC [Deltaproteobacteria bacterium TMED126]|tara:strand:- start:2377 stop:2667 length:291 start_codon:yes stop_codon:yes gene_type:complete
MPVDKELVEKISKLSRLNIDESKINDFVSNFEEILNYINLLEQVPDNNKQNEEDLISDYATRDDSVIEKLSNKEVLMNAKNKDGNFFTVKKVIDEE